MRRELFFFVYIFGVKINSISFKEKHIALHFVYFLVFNNFTNINNFIFNSAQLDAHRKCKKVETNLPHQIRNTYVKQSEAKQRYIAAHNVYSTESRQTGRKERRKNYIYKYTTAKHNEKFEAWKTVSLTLNKMKYTIQK